MRRGFKRSALRAGVVGLAIAGLSIAIAAPSLAEGTRAAAHAAYSAPANVPAPTRNSQFGASVVLLNGIAAISAPGANKNVGGVYIYTRSGGAFKQQALISEPGGHSGDVFGWSIALSEGGSSTATLAIGAVNAANLRGAVYIYVLSGSTWRRQFTINDPDTSGVYDEFGYSVALQGNTLLVGSINAGSSGQGRAYSYARSGSTWNLNQTLADPLNKINDNFGMSIAVSGRTAIIGAQNATHSPYQGAAYLYTKSGSTWHLLRRLSNPGSSRNGFGFAVALQGTTAVVGALNQARGGTIYVYTRDGGAWPRQASFSDPRKNLVDDFGASVAIWKNRIVVGAPIAVLGTPPSSECPRVYEYLNSARRWKLKSVVVGPTCRGNDAFGSAVTVWGTIALVGDPEAKGSSGAVYTLTLP